MKKVAILFLVTVLIYFSGFAQFSFHVFPYGVGGDPYADTILNTRAILLAAGIRQVNAYQTFPEISKTFASKIVNINKNGSIDKITICFARNKKTNFTFCIDDTILYDPAGRMTSLKMTDNNGNKHFPRTINYTGEKEIEVLSRGMQLEDSSVSHQSYNEMGQLIKLIRTWKGQETENTLFYYNSDGLLDSTQNTHWGTFIFKRRKKGKGKMIETKNSKWSYQWIYNHSGQCISSAGIMKYSPGDILESGYKGDLKSEVKYFYNPDGTLSKVVAKRTGGPAFTTYYSYVK